MTEWYYTDASRARVGPVSVDALRMAHATGALTSDALVWRDGWAQWVPWRDALAEVLPADAPPALAPDTWAPRTGTVAVADAAQAHSPYAPPVTPVSDASGVVLGGDVVFAGFWKRFAAYAIDGLLMSIVAGGLQVAVGLGLFGAAGTFSSPEALFSTSGGLAMLAAMYLVPMAIQAVYYAWFHASAAQATLGKMAVGIKVVREDGRPVSFGLGIGRFFGLILSSIPLGIGFLMAGFTDRKRALHDMVCSTLVVDRWAYTAHPERQRRELGGVTLAIIILAVMLCVAYLGFAAFVGVMMARNAG